MNLASITIRKATVEDAQDIADLYAPYVDDTAISFEYEAPDAAEMARRIAAISAGYPYLVARDAAGALLGYTYAGPLKGRAAYARSVETTIYLAPAAKGQGLGRRLYTALEDALRDQGILNSYACIAHTRHDDDPHLTNASEAFHTALGYRLIGTFNQCGWKFGRWYDMVWMEKMLGHHADE